MSTHPIFADTVVSISDLKKNPMIVIDQGKGFPVAILKKNVPVFYAVPAAAYEALIDKLDDMELAQIVREREEQPSRVITPDEL